MPSHGYCTRAGASAKGFFQRAGPYLVAGPFVFLPSLFFVRRQASKSRKMDPSSLTSFLRSATGKQIPKVLDGEGADSIALGEFTGPANFPTSAGPDIKQMLTEELKKVGVEVKVRAKFGVKGSYAAAEQPSANPDDARIGKKVLAVKLAASPSPSPCHRRAPSWNATRTCARRSPIPKRTARGPSFAAIPTSLTLWKSWSTARPGRPTTRTAWRSCRSSAARPTPCA
jgi:hypothetical protein